MKKIPTIFERNPDKLSEVSDQTNPVCHWVFRGEGVATRKYDGTCCLIEDGQFFKRREIKKDKPVPADFISVDIDSVTGKYFGWVPVDLNLPENKYHKEAWDRRNILSGTCELIGPKIQGNPEGFPTHELAAHQGAPDYPDAPRNFHGLREWLIDKDIEGLVFHHPDGRMAKIKKKDFGLKREALL